MALTLIRCGDKYEGQWHENKRRGNGTMYWYSKSEVYKGEWSNDIQHGYGEHTWKIESHNHSQVIIIMYTKMSASSK